MKIKDVELNQCIKGSPLGCFKKHVDNILTCLTPEHEIWSLQIKCHKLQVSKSTLKGPPKTLEVGLVSFITLQGIEDGSHARYYRVPINSNILSFAPNSEFSQKQKFRVYRLWH